jgi:hypothetical protein
MVRIYGFAHLRQSRTLFTILAILATCVVIDISMLVRSIPHGQQIRKDDGKSIHIGKNRYRWRLVREGQPFGQSYENVYLDSPASTPSIFGPEARLYCLPASEDDRNLTCLLVQATDGDHGVRYKRVGLVKIQKIYPGVSSIKEPPGNSKSTLGRYYWGPDGKVKVESTICII